MYQECHGLYPNKRNTFLANWDHEDNITLCDFDWAGLVQEKEDYQTEKSNEAHWGELIKHLVE